ncbi:UPF0175 family protein [Iningainema tapete]|uniref:UPF0175 family protein n=1 Tax=Iningainema tapete BLCC-T55 TaxID=2748662 RepID=A0A8J7C7V2_9CYAN|nr:UPF0175 family protein [Iningainema tapete]MBD2776204.1 UPF0175 family protein [Iningainema tapete BLCC-T55]
MSTKQPELEIKVTGELPELAGVHHQEAEHLAREAYVMILLKHGIISSGKAGELLGMHRLDVIELMEKYDISVFPNQTREELEQEVAQTLALLKQHRP